MSGIYIPGMENLKCNDCFWAIGYRLKCSCSSEQANYDTGERPKDCPLIPVPDHGRLGDLDALWDKVKDTNSGLGLRQKRESLIYDAGFLAGFRVAVKIALKMPTVIPADKGAGE